MPIEICTVGGFSETGKNSTAVKIDDEVIILDGDKSIESAISKGHTIAGEVNKTRSLSNTPGGDMTPKILAKSAKDAVKDLPISVKVLGEKEMKKICEGCTGNCLKNFHALWTF